MKSNEYKPTHGGYPNQRRGAMWFQPKDWRKAPSYRLGDPGVVDQLQHDHIRHSHQGGGCGQSDDINFGKTGRRGG